MATGPGWFCQDCGPHVNQVRGCEGTALSKSLWAAGYEVRCVGIVGHRKTVDLFAPPPSAAPDTPPRFRWPEFAACNRYSVRYGRNRLKSGWAVGVSAAPARTS